MRNKNCIRKIQTLRSLAARCQPKEAADVTGLCSCRIKDNSWKNVGSWKCLEGPHIHPRAVPWRIANSMPQTGVAGVTGLLFLAGLRGWRQLQEQVPVCSLSLWSWKLEKEQVALPAAFQETGTMGAWVSFGPEAETSHAASLWVWPHWVLKVDLLLKKESWRRPGYSQTTVYSWELKPTLPALL